MSGVVFIAVLVLWVLGFLCAGVVYYGDRRGLGPSLWRGLAAAFWPIGIPIDFLFVDKHRRNQRRARS
jgi:hypothetical protein